MKMAAMMKMIWVWNNYHEEKRERGQSTHSNKIGLHGGTGWVDLVERWLGRYG